MTYRVDFKRECDYTQLSIANSELCSVLSLIERSRNDEVNFYKYVAYAKQLQEGLFNLEWELKKRLRGETTDSTERV